MSHDVPHMDRSFS